ncbi:hypothetical protein PMAYCL1PPCAC_05395, partial [Pristionchus mayeri]
GDHFKPSDYIHKLSQRVLRMNAVPFFLEVALCNSGKIPNEIKEEAGVIQEEPIAQVFTPSTGKEAESVPLVDITCVCSECGKNLLNKSSLEFHMRIHTGAKTFLCPHCDAYFLNSSHRNNHIRFVHHKIQTARKEPAEAESTKTAKKNVCTECGQRLTSKQRLTEHMLLHAGKKPFLCPHCNTSFCGVGIRSHHIRS